MQLLSMEAKELSGALSVVNLSYSCLSERLKQLCAVERMLDSPSLSPSVGYLTCALLSENRGSASLLLGDDQKRETSVVVILALEVATSSREWSPSPLFMGIWLSVRPGVCNR
mgnify:CR=1 FL=1